MHSSRTFRTAPPDGDCPLGCRLGPVLRLYTAVIEDCVAFIIPNQLGQFNIMPAAAAARVGASVAADGSVKLTVNFGGMVDTVDALVTDVTDGDWDLMLGMAWIRKHSAHIYWPSRSLRLVDPRTGFKHALREKREQHDVLFIA